jgi:hypothetical protein
VQTSVPTSPGHPAHSRSPGRASCSSALVQASPASLPGPNSSPAPKPDRPLPCAPALGEGESRWSSTGSDTAWVTTSLFPPIIGTGPRPAYPKCCGPNPCFWGPDPSRRRFLRAPGTRTQQQRISGVLCPQWDGRRKRRGDRFSLAIEATAFGSPGEDSSEGRTVVGIQVIPLVEF